MPAILATLATATLATATLAAAALSTATLTTTTLAAGPTHTEGNPDLIERLEPRVTELAERQLREVGVPGLIVGVLSGGDTAYFGYGRIANTAGAPVPTSDTLYETGSISKVFTAVLLANAEHRGELAIDDPIETLVPDGVTVPTFQPTGDNAGNTPDPVRAQITLADLATHHSGLPRMPANFLPITNDPFRFYPREAMYAFLELTPVFTEPGTNYSYSNYATGLLGCLLERAAGGTRYPDLLAQRITGPLGLADTVVITKDFQLPPDQLRRAATPHNGADPMNAWRFDSLAPAGAITSTAHDLLTFAQASIQASIDAANLPLKDAEASKSHLTHALRRVLEPQHEVSNTTDIALGWHIRNGRFHWHNGATGGSRSMLMVDHEAKSAVVVLINANTASPGSVARPLIRQLGRESRGEADRPRDAAPAAGG